MKLSIDYRNAVDQIIDIVARKEHMYGCKKYGYMTFTMPQHQLTVDRRREYGINNKVHYDIVHPEFSIVYDCSWPAKTSMWLWNNVVIKPNTANQPLYNYYDTQHIPGGNITVLYNGNVDSMQELAMWLWLS